MHSDKRGEPTFRSDINCHNVNVFVFLHLKEIQHHDGDGHKNGMRGFHMKVYSESGVPELEVVSAEVGSYSQSILYLPIAC